MEKKIDVYYVCPECLRIAVHAENIYSIIKTYNLVVYEEDGKIYEDEIEGKIVDSEYADTEYYHEDENYCYSTIPSYDTWFSPKHETTILETIEKLIKHRVKLEKLMESISKDTKSEREDIREAAKAFLEGIKKYILNM